MSSEAESGGHPGYEAYVREQILPLAPAGEPVPFRGRLHGSSDPLPFFEEMEASLRDQDGAVWNVMGPPGCGKTYLARWAAARWGRQYLEDPRGAPGVLWVDGLRLKAAFTDDRAITGGPFAFALAAGIPGETPDSMARLLVQHPFIVIIDKDASVLCEGWNVELPMALPPGLKVLHLAIKDSLGGPSVLLGPWDMETALLAAHGRLGAEGVRRIEALGSSPAVALRSYPLFTGWLLEKEGLEPGTIEDGTCVLAFLRDILRSVSHGLERNFVSLCEETLIARRAHPEGVHRDLARMLHLEVGLPRIEDWGRTFRVFLLAALLKDGRHLRALEASLLEETELALLGRLPLQAEALLSLSRGKTKHPIASTNLINLHWSLTRTEVPPGLFRGDLSNVHLPGHRFLKGLQKLSLLDSNLTGISLGEPRAIKCGFERCSFREASLPGTHFKDCKLQRCSFGLADLSGCRFETCVFTETQLADAVLGGATFVGGTLEVVAFGLIEKGNALHFTKCLLKACRLAGLASAGFFLEDCSLRGMSFEGLEPAAFECEGSSFTECDLSRLAAPGAKLRGAQFGSCILADVRLRGADLRGARFSNVSFQPGPASRAGHTVGSSRWNPQYGSKSGFYAQDLSEGVYADPELTRTADLRDADLTGAVFESTDLFRVDLRGAKLDPDLLSHAIQMQAFVD